MCTRAHLAVASTPVTLKQSVERRIHMATKSVRIDEDLYRRIEAHKRDDETFSEGISRLTSDHSLLAFAGGGSAEAADRHRDLLAEADATAREDRRERLHRPGVDTE